MKSLIDYYNLLCVRIEIVGVQCYVTNSVAGHKSFERKLDIL